MIIISIFLFLCRSQDSSSSRGRGGGRGRPPAHLRGKALGLWYRDQNAKVNKDRKAEDDAAIRRVRVVVENTTTFKSNSIYIFFNGSETHSFFHFDLVEFQLHINP